MEEGPQPYSYEYSIWYVRCTVESVSAIEREGRVLLHWWKGEEVHYLVREDYPFSSFPILVAKSVQDNMCSGILPHGLLRKEEYFLPLSF